MLYVNEIYLEKYSNDLSYLDDFVPPQFLTNDANTKRNRWLKNDDKTELIKLNKSYRLMLFALEGAERTLFIMQTMNEFIDRYPKYANLITNQKEFDLHMQDLKKQI